MFTCIGYYQGEYGYCHIYINADYESFDGDYTLKDEVSILFLVHKDDKDKLVNKIVENYSNKKEKNKMVYYYNELLKSELVTEFERLKKIGVVFGAYYEKIYDRLVLDKI